MPRMRVLLPHVFAQKPVDVGDEYEATESEASLLSHLAWSERIDPDKPAPTRRRNGRAAYSNRALTS
jgi:hypothetical protein